MRHILLWLARNAWLRDRLPRLPFMQRAVRRFMPGETMNDALHAAEPLQAAGIGTIYTRLGENLVSLDEADAVASHYMELIDRIQAVGLRGEPSVKPTQLGLDLDPEATYAHLSRIAAHAAEAGSFLWVDMEGSAYTEATIALYERLRAEHANTGLCLQAYLRRTAADIERLLPLGPAIRLVKGAYDEPSRIAYRDRREVDANYLALAVLMIRESRARHVRLGLGTHDVGLIRRVTELAGAAGVERDAFEVQMLYGIRARDQLSLARQGYRVQTLIAYGEFWYPWYMRRLAERPANVLFALRQLLP
jgi:proline dehydrogenase